MTKKTTESRSYIYDMLDNKRYVLNGDVGWNLI